MKICKKSISDKIKIIEDSINYLKDPPQGSIYYEQDNTEEIRFFESELEKQKKLLENETSDI